MSNTKLITICQLEPSSKYDDQQRSTIKNNNKRKVGVADENGDYDDVIGKHKK